MKNNDVRHLPWWDFYLRLEELATAYLAPSYDAIFYMVRGGLTPAHRLAHRLGLPAGGPAMFPLPISRSELENSTGGLRLPPLPPIAPGSRLLLVEDTIGEGKALLAGISALQALEPSVIDVVTVGLNHRDWLLESGLALADSPLRQAIVGFDYWSWMVFPWENQAIESFGQPGNLRPYKPGEAIARPLQLLDESFESVAGAVLGPGGSGPCVVLNERNFQEARSLPADSVDWVIVRDLLPSRLELLHWRELAEVIAFILRPGGRLLFPYLDRSRIQEPRHIVPQAEYFTPALVDRMLTKVGFARTEYLASSDRASFARATMPV